MAQYKVPQDVEADDKLLGPFSFRQFIYLLVAAGLGFVAYVLFQLFPLLVLIPVPFIIFLFVLALPLKKDQPMETYLSAVVEFYTKPQQRIWEPGQIESTITITAPKVTEEDRRTKDISREEAGRRLSFLANIVDTEGYAIKEGANSNLRDDIASEAANAADIFDQNQNYVLNQSLQQSNDNRRNQLLAEMRTALDAQQGTVSQVAPAATPAIDPIQPIDITASAATIMPDMNEIHEILEATKQSEEPEKANTEDDDGPILMSEPTDDAEATQTESAPIEESISTEEPATTEESAPIEEPITNETPDTTEEPTPSAPTAEEAPPQPQTDLSTNNNDQEVYISLH